jgi:hypothetical protein
MPGVELRGPVHARVHPGRRVPRLPAGSGLPVDRGLLLAVRGSGHLHGRVHSPVHSDERLLGAVRSHWRVPVGVYRGRRLHVPVCRSYRVHGPVHWMRVPGDGMHTGLRAGFGLHRSVLRQHLPWLRDAGDRLSGPVRRAGTVHGMRISGLGVHPAMLGAERLFGLPARYRRMSVAVSGRGPVRPGVLRSMPTGVHLPGLRVTMPGSCAVHRVPAGGVHVAVRSSIGLHR